MAEQKDSANVRFHLYKNNEYDNPAYSYKPKQIPQVIKFIKLMCVCKLCGTVQTENMIDP